VLIICSLRIRIDELSSCNMPPRCRWGQMVGANDVEDAKALNCHSMLSRTQLHRTCIVYVLLSSTQSRSGLGCLSVRLSRALYSDTSSHTSTHIYGVSSMIPGLAEDNIINQNMSLNSMVEENLASNPHAKDSATRPVGLARKFHSSE
jgi:hypothetical protein